MNQKKLNQYLKYMTSLSDKDREALYSRSKGYFSKEEIAEKLKEPIKQRDKSPYREIELSGWWNDVFAPQATINNITSTPTKLYNGITIRRLKEKDKDMNKIPYKGEIKRRWLQLAEDNNQNFCEDILCQKIVDAMKKENKVVTFEQIQEVIKLFK